MSANVAEDADSFASNWVISIFESKAIIARYTTLPDIPVPNHFLDTQGWVPWVISKKAKRFDHGGLDIRR